MTDDWDRSARRLGAAANIAHGFVYFAPEATTSYREIGLDPTQHYFASRAAPLGPVPPAVVEAVFFNFAPHQVRRAIPSAWEVATPAAAQQARFDGVAAVFERIGGIGLGADELDDTSTLLRGVIDAVDFGGKALAAANRDVPLPDHPEVSVWQLATVVREWRGDAHNAVLASTPLTAVEALVLHAATGKVPVAALRDTRGWSDTEWRTAVTALAERGLTDIEGAFTDEGRSFRASIEDRTDVACRPLVDAIGIDHTARLTSLLSQMGAHFSTAGLYASLGR